MPVGIGAGSRAYTKSAVVFNFFGRQDREATHSLSMTPINVLTPHACLTDIIPLIVGLKT